MYFLNETLVIVHDKNAIGNSVVEGEGDDDRYGNSHGKGDCDSDGKGCLQRYYCTVLKVLLYYVF